MLDSLFLVIESLETAEDIIYLLSALFAFVLLGLSVSAYLKTRMKVLKYAIIAFALFAVYLTYEYLDEVYEAQIDTPYNDVVFGLVTFGVTLFFFLAIVGQRRRKIQLED
jgi:predicted MFS family arabinose efflux permease